MHRIIATVILLLGTVPAGTIYPAYPIVNLKYSGLDDYYLECMSLHDGTGYVIIMSDGNYRLYCADGHEAYQEHPIRIPVPFIRTIEGGRLLQQRKKRIQKGYYHDRF